MKNLRRNRNKMPEKYSCPKCGKELEEKYVIHCTCPHCHEIFDKPAIQQVSSQEDQEKEHPDRVDKEVEEEHEELPSKTINKVQLLALFSLLIISLVSYFTISRIAINRKATQERLRFATLPQQTEEETPQAGKLEEPGGVPLPTPQQQKEEEEKRQAEILQDKKLQETEEKATKAEKLPPEAEKTLEEMRIAAQKEKEKQFQYYYDKGEAAIRQSGGSASALEFYQTALTYKPGDQKTQGKINFILAMLKAAQEIKQAEPKLQETKITARQSKSLTEKLKTITSLNQPYLLSYVDAPTDRLTVQYAVIEICKRAGIAYNWSESQQNTDPICRKWIRPNIQGRSTSEALQKILEPVGLTYIIKNGTVVLQKKTE